VRDCRTASDTAVCYSPRNFELLVLQCAGEHAWAVGVSRFRTIPTVSESFTPEIRTGLLFGVIDLELRERIRLVWGKRWMRSPSVH